MIDVEEGCAMLKMDDFKLLADLRLIVDPTVYSAIFPYITLQMSPYFTISSTGKVEGSRTQKGVQALVKIDKKIKKGYRFIQWIDYVQGPGFGQGNVKVNFN